MTSAFSKNPKIALRILYVKSCTPFQDRIVVVPWSFLFEFSMLDDVRMVVRATYLTPVTYLHSTRLALWTFLWILWEAVLRYMTPETKYFTSMRINGWFRGFSLRQETDKCKANAVLETALDKEVAEVLGRCRWSYSFLHRSKLCGRSSC